MSSIQFFRHIIYISMLLAISAYAEELKVATVDSAEGVVETRAASGSSFKQASPGDPLLRREFIRTGRDSRAGVMFNSGVLLRLASNTTLELRSEGEKAEESKDGIFVKFGKVFLFDRSDAPPPIVNTPTVTAAIIGTEIVVEASEKASSITVLEGSAKLSNKFGELTLSSGERGTTQLGMAPVKTLLVSARDAVQWALSYPSTLVEDELQRSDASVSKALLAHERGDYSRAIDILSAVSTEIHPEAGVLLSSYLLERGEVEKAQKVLSAISKKSRPSIRAQALAQEGVIAIVTGETDLAARLIAEGERVSPESKSILLARSYLQQARFDLLGAERTLEKLSLVSPDNSFYFVRRAELALARNDRTEAEELLGRALALQPEDSYALTVAGFVALIKGELPAANRSFERALTKNSSGGLAHLGLGLAKFREGDVSGGKSEIEKAVYLDPGVSLYRSYLGKAFFETEDESRAAKEYIEAIRLDPNDPTPYLYRAYLELSKNDPISALGDVEESISKNNNRAVYRSRMLLDQDVAVRGAGLSETFNALGFSQLARVEAIKSISKDYGNFSAHRLLADSYTSTLLDDAFRSERRVAELLAPLSFNLFQNPGSQASINEYSALFDKSEDRVQVGAGYLGNLDEISPNVSMAGKGLNSGYFLGFDSRLGGGSKSNDFSRLYRARGSYQYQPDIDNRFILSGEGDYSRNRASSNLENDLMLENGEINAGYHGVLSPSSQIISQLSYGRTNENIHNDAFGSRSAIIHETLGDEEAYDTVPLVINEFSHETLGSFRAALQYIYNSEWVSFVGGGEYLSSDVSRREGSLILDGWEFTGLGKELRSTGQNNLHSFDEYIYSILHLDPMIDLTAGASFTELNIEDSRFAPFADSTESKSKFSPKVGVNLYPFKDTVVRAAYYEGLRKTSFQDTTVLEPTLVGGINQRFGDFPGTSFRAWSVGVDQKLWSGGYFGVEGGHRHSEIPFREATTLFDANYNNGTLTSGTVLGDRYSVPRGYDTASGYFYQVITDRVVGSLTHDWFFLGENDQGTLAHNSLHKSEAALRYFDPSGWYSSLIATFRYQDRLNSPFSEGSSTFWLFNGAVGYRIPNRHGRIEFGVDNIFNQSFTYDQLRGFEDLVPEGLGVRVVGVFNF